MPLEQLRSLARAGLILFVVAAIGDAYLTYLGLAGSVELEGNPVMKGAMRKAGIVPALLAVKSLVGLACWFIAVRVGRAIHDNEEWIWSLPMLPPVRAWLKAGDRCYLALLPLYGVAFGQMLAAFAWASL